MAQHLFRRVFLKGSVLTAGALAQGSFPDAFAVSRKEAQVFFTRNISIDSLLKLYVRINQPVTGKATGLNPHVMKPWEPANFIR